MFSSMRARLPRQFARGYRSGGPPGSTTEGDQKRFYGLLGGAAIIALGRSKHTLPFAKHHTRQLTTPQLLNHFSLTLFRIAYGYTRYKNPHDYGPFGRHDFVEPAFQKTGFIDFKLKETIPINHDTSLFRFELEPTQKLGMTATSCLVVKETLGDDEKPTVRPYTPVTDMETYGHFDLVVKKYETGKMSSHIHSMSPGDKLMMKGPIQKYPYTANKLKEIGMIAGGSGITPMLQLITHVLDNPDDKTKLTLVFANKSEDDIILRSRLDDLAKKHPDKLKVHYVVDKAQSPNWKGDVGFVTKELVQKYMPASSNQDVLVSVCGPLPMVKSISGAKAPDYSQGEVGGIFKELGYTSDQVFKF
ncbi:hypothetical protein GGH99_003934 [Coemansia sp. RSA 1285]|nr:hypothetical protein GGH99_003934 [Coemansia sp. RSA 1285]